MWWAKILKYSPNPRKFIIQKKDPINEQINIFFWITTFLQNYIQPCYTRPQVSLIVVFIFPYLMRFLKNKNIVHKSRSINSWLRWWWCTWHLIFSKIKWLLYLSFIFYFDFAFHRLSYRQNIDCFWEKEFGDWFLLWLSLHTFSCYIR